MAIGIRPTVDFAFKRLLGSPEHPDVTIHFLNAVLADGPRITAVEILNPILEKDATEDKFAVLDVLARDELGRRLNIEMQTALPAGMAERLTYYAACLFAEQFDVGVGYAKSRAAISICVLDAVLFRTSPAYHLDFRLRERGGLTLTDHLQIHLLELPKYQPPADNTEVAGPLEKWLYFLRHAGDLTKRELTEKLADAEFATAAEVLEMISRTPEERRIYEGREKARRDEAARMEYAIQTATAESLARGLEQGLVQGLLRGMERGTQIGRIQVMQELLGRVVATTDELAVLEPSLLARLLAELEQQLQRQRSGN